MTSDERVPMSEWQISTVGHKLDLWWCKATRSWGMKISGGKVKIPSLLLM